MNRLVAAVFAFAPILGAQAQLPQYHAQVFGAEQGIGGGGIADVFKDRRQFLWIVNLNSLQRFDGRNVHTYPFEHTVKQALCDRDDRVWALSGGKVWHTGNDKEGFFEAPFDATGGGLPLAIFQLAGRPFCLLASKGLFAWQRDDKRFERLPLSPPPPLNYTNLWRFASCGNSIFYHGTDKVHAFDMAAGKTRSLPFKEEIAFLYALTPGLAVLTDYNSQSYWCDFSGDSIVKIDPRRYGLSKGPDILGITGVAPIGNGRFLMSSRTGMLEYDLIQDRFTRERIYAGGKPLELEDLYMRVFIDENGTVWAHNVNNIIAAGNLRSTFGLLRNYHNDSTRAWSNRSIGIAEDGEGNLWIGGAGGFKKLDLRSGKITPFPATEGATDRPSHPSVRGMGFDGRYVIIGPTDKGVWLFDPKTERYRRPGYANDSVRLASESDFIDHLAVMRNGDIVVAGRFHPYCIKAGSYRMDFIRFPGDDSNTNAVFQDAGGRVWIGSHSSVFCLDETYRLLATFPTEAVYCLLNGSNRDEILVGTDKGLRRITNSGVDTIPTPAEGAGVTSMLRDSLQRLWLGTLGGLYLADSNIAVFKKFDFADNIQGLVFNGMSSLRASNGMAFFSGVNGINYFFPEQITLEDRPLTVSIQAMRINDRDSVAQWLPSGEIRLPFRFNTLSFELAAPYFNNAGKVQYRYRLKGASEEWIHTGGGNRIRLAGLPPGDYVLDVAAGTSGNTWYEAAQSLRIRILPPFWQTWPFRLGVIAAFAASAFGFIRFREDRIRKQQSAHLEMEKLQNANLLYQLQLAKTEEEKQHALLEAVENRRKAAEAKLQSMRLQMNPHFLFNALNSIQQMTLSGNGDGAVMYLSKFSKLLRLVLTLSDREEVTLRQEMEMLQLYLELESLRFDDTFEYLITCENTLDPDEYKAPPMLIQPFVENAIWHGLLHKEGRRTLRIHFHANSADALVCTIEDNGIGREAASAYARNGAHAGKATATGMERIETLNRRYGQRNTLEITDLHGPDGNAAGTRVVITLY